MAFVFGADAAVLGASFGCFGSGVIQAFSLLPIFFGPLVLIIVAPVEFVVFAVGWACFFHVYLVFLLVNRGFKDCEAFGTYALGFFDFCRCVSPLAVVKAFKGDEYLKFFRSFRR